ncbi:uncharacterized protein LOC143809189 [Ranitomeya variabilis]|uniref:uncharacterized protein LOC143809189 n=1 Tax=Ranitomeya variabilis TaxID=490064 RepID=UPI0040571B72
MMPRYLLVILEPCTFVVNILRFFNVCVGRRRRQQPPAPASSTSGSPQPGTSRRRRRQQPSARAGTPSSATSGSSQPGISHAVRTRRATTPPQATTPPFRHSSSTPGSAAFSPEATLPAAAGAQARGWEVSSSSTSSGDDQPASLLQATTVRDLLAKQRRLEGTAAHLQGTAARLQETASRLQEQVKAHGRMLRQLLAHRRGTM